MAVRLIADSISPPERASRRSVRVGVAGVLAFVMIAVLVQLRVLAGIDLFLMRLKEPFTAPLLDSLGEYCAVAVSGEFSVVYGIVGAALLWRAGVGRWSLASLGFVVVEPLEIVLKLVVQQRQPPTEFYRHINYGLTSVVLSGSFPSGHALRSAFLLVFLAVLIGADGPLRKKLGRAGARVAQAACFVLALLCGLSRIYLGYHWPSDVLAGLILGASVALLCAGPVVQRINLRQPSFRLRRSGP